MNQTRTFIAVDLPLSIQESIEKQTTRLRQTLGDDVVRWVAPHNMHLTLKFLGNAPTTHLDFLKQMLTQAADATPQFDLQIGGIGSFPNSKRPRVLWVGLHAPASLASLQKLIEEGANRLGYEKEERPFSPHLTLGRVRQGIDVKELQKISNALSTIQLGKIGTARVDSVHLYKSDLNSDGSVYTKLFSTPLR
ncbi:MAG: RNA 2',3'-cyclic phosphodiesterase [Chloroflexi bacterium]|nr:RNA 2',3'-cyclic phosphodiesterase [Chloroflexota bacterium]